MDIAQNNSNSERNASDDIRVNKVRNNSTERNSYAPSESKVDCFEGSANMGENQLDRSS